jgi:hypothetical protein
LKKFGQDQANAQQSSVNHEDSGQPSAPSALPVYTSAAVDASSFPHDSSAMTVNTAAAVTQDSRLVNDPQADAQSLDANFVGGDGYGDEKVRMSEHEMPKIFTSSDWIKRGGETSQKENDVVTGPWGGRRWVPKSSRYPRSAQVRMFMCVCARERLTWECYCFCVNTDSTGHAHARARAHTHTPSAPEMV